MLRRAKPLVEKARERIRAAAEHDPHAWPERDDDRAILVHDEETQLPPELPGHAEAPDGPEGAGATRPPLGSPEPGAPDLDGPMGPGGVSGPPKGGRPLRSGERTSRLPRDRTATSPDGAVPMGLRTAAAWSWRLIIVLAGLYVLL